MLSFFVPLGVSASLVTLSHVIINGTLARSAEPERIIAGYAIAMSLMGITERPAVLLRQTCSTLVRDRRSFRAMRLVALYVFAAIMAVGLTISYLPPGRWLFGFLFGVSGGQLTNVMNVYRILMFVSIFSGLRCLYHGLIISNRRTLWLTIGMLVRLLGMYVLSQYFIVTHRVTSSNVGAIIFLVGMAIECGVAVWEGTMLLKKRIPEQSEHAPSLRPSGIFTFYRPLLLSSFLAVIIGPALNGMLGKTSHAETAIAAFAIAASVTNLVQSFFSYIHQIVLNFYRLDSGRVLRFVISMGLIPTLLIGILSYTPAGPWLMTHVIGANESLMAESLRTLRVFMILTIVFPWLDYCNGMLMLRRQTRIMMGSQAANVTATVLTLVILILAAPGWNGIVGALAQSLGTACELLVAAIAVRRGKDEVPLAAR
ncbi:multi antimicrobial extrusion protein MatE [Gordoniibacillus kamchatkensis]|uniref:Multi antimicrobial extrusion protein MatE n=1 Tax=Gordoniibacillus kamchatkensis TaxID=1590651 RepID=A0ABR5ANE0_9BACL|nr:multi antimicrobial extrusion protein MatE [Paenibacillus sp. VKM B-2647]